MGFEKALVLGLQDLLLWEKKFEDPPEEGASIVFIVSQRNRKTAVWYAAMNHSKTVWNKIDPSNYMKNATANLTIWQLLFHVPQYWRLNLSNGHSHLDALEQWYGIVVANTMHLHTYITQCLGIYANTCLSIHTITLTSTCMLGCKHRCTLRDGLFLLLYATPQND